MKTVVRPETEMKNSGIEYIGKIPNDWEVRKAGYLAAKITDYVASGSFATLAQNVQYLDEPDYARLIRTVDLSGSVNKQPVYVSKEAYKFLSNSNLFGGELILPNIGSVGCVYQYKKIYEHATLAPNSILLDMKENNRFYFYWFSNPIVGESLKMLGNSTVQVKFNKSQLRQYMLPRPPLSEQQAIADYLDKTCAKIDEIIAEAKASIDEYKELKQSVIFEAVTKGLDKNVEMKDSGVEWIGETPNSWNIRMLNQYVSQVKCKNLDLSETNLLSLSYGKIKRKDINSNGGLLPESFDNYNIVDENDIVLRLTDLQNDHKSLRVGLVTERGIITSAYVTIRPKKINAAYLALLLHAFDYKKGFYGMGSGIRQGLTFDGIKSLKIVIPSDSEQDDIVKYVMKMIDKCDSLIFEKESLINDLEAYKKSLIYEVVTGKRRVV